MPIVVQLMIAALKLKSGYLRLLAFVNHSGVRFIIAVVLVAMILRILDQEEIWERLKHVNLEFVLLMFAVNIVLLLLFAGRWQSIIWKLGFSVPYSVLLRTIWLSAFFGQFGPTLVFAEVTRFCSIRAYAKTTRIIMSQVFDRLSGQLVLIVVVLALSPVYFQSSGTTGLRNLVTLIICLAVVATVIALMLGKYRDFLKIESKTALSTLHPLRSPGHYGFSFVIQVLLVLNFCLAAIGLHVLEDPWGFVTLVPLLLTGIALLPISVSDWGTREATAIVLFSHIGVEAEKIVSVSILFGAVNLISALPGGLFLLGNGRRSAASSMIIARNRK